MVDFIGHAVALYSDDSFINRPAIEVYKKIILYMNSMGAYGDSPFIYPIYGLAGIPEGFSRKCALFVYSSDFDPLNKSTGRDEIPYPP